MRPRSRLALLLLVATLSGSLAAVGAPTAGQETPPATGEETPQTAPGGANASPKPFEPGRGNLQIPDTIWREALAALGWERGDVLGFTSEEMAHFGGTAHVIPAVDRMFRNARAVPGLGASAASLAQSEGNIGSAAWLGYRFLDVYAGRGVSPPGPETWGVDWIPEEAGMDTSAALDAVLRQGCAPGVQFTLERAKRASWDALPEPLQRLVLRVVVAMLEAGPWLRAAFDEAFYRDMFDTDNLDGVPMEDWYAFAMTPWRDMVPARAPFDALGRVDQGYLAFGSILFLRYLQGAIAAYRALEQAPAIPADWAGLSFETAAGRVGVFGPGSDTIDGTGYAFILDLGGDDTYTGACAVPRSFAQNIGAVVDLGGDDVYDAGDVPAGLACGNHGVGALVDVAGDDRYVATTSGIACAVYGTGVLADLAGDDRYEGEDWTQGSAHVGVAALLDAAGDDSYTCHSESQAFGSTYGVGLLVDNAGNDRYVADLAGNISQTFRGHSVSFAQGTGFGRRADFGDGHCLGGGIGILADAAGDDRYLGGVYCQGSAYWWAYGALEDHAGNDTYSSIQYSQGSAPHCGLASFVDLSGDDRYNLETENLYMQNTGCARDGSIAVFIDGDGDDQYRHGNRAAGSAHINSICLFWDRCGDDRYVCERGTPSGGTRSYGCAPPHGQSRGTWRERVPNVGLFLDTGGRDVWEERIPEAQADSLHRLECADNHRWQHNAHPTSQALGWDIDAICAPAGE